jgi:Alcohol dehydrogenase GroES-like domain
VSPAATRGPPPGEPVGVIAALGEGLEPEYELGQRVIVGAITPCGQCFDCLSGVHARSRQFGASHVINITEQDPLAEIKRLTGAERRCCDRSARTAGNLPVGLELHTSGRHALQPWGVFR